MFIFNKEKIKQNQANKKYLLSFDVGLTGYYSLLSIDLITNNIIVLYSKQIEIEQKEDNLLIKTNKSKAIVKNQISFKKNKIDIDYLINKYNLNKNNCFCLVEQLTPRPINSTISIMSLGDSGGLIRALIDCLSFNYNIIPPGTWKANLNITADKSSSQKLFNELIKDNKISICNKAEKYINHNKVESVLIAYYYAINYIINKKV